VETGESSGGGNLHVDINCESVNLKGLFGLPFSGMLSTALCGGYVAGTEAARSLAGRSLKGADAQGEIDPVAVQREKEKILALQERKEGYAPKDYEDLIRQVMEHYMGHRRSLKGLNIALDRLALIESEG
jgi:succinate dehydrogenase/fumarate reductase flavoprotein subunit